MAVWVAAALLSGVADAATPDHARTVAVMDFDNRSPTGEWDWLGKGSRDLPSAPSVARARAEE